MDRIEEIKKEIEEKLNKIKDEKELNEIRIEFMSKKGKITNLSNLIKEIDKEKRKEFGMKLNEIKTLFETKYKEQKDKLDKLIMDKKLENEYIDVSLPSTKISVGSPNILEKVIEEIEELLISMGYDVVEGPEIEEDKYNFEMLNLPKGHPARDAQDTFYVKDETLLLRSQTSPVQVRTMLEAKGNKPIRIICPGKTYRRDDDDATHSHQFMQIEGLVIDRDISMADLKGTLELFCKHILGEKTEVRFRPSFFPFTEPSVEVDVTCFKCGGKGCSLCKQTGWIEVLGAGMVHPNVLEMGGYDSKKYQAFAFGTGMDRFAMFKYAIPDIRTIYANDLRFLEEFDRKDVE